MQNCSLKRRMLLVLIALLFLPAVSAFAQTSPITTSEFPFLVTDSAGNPVVSASIYVWDTGYQTYYYPGSAYSAGPILTDSTGKAKVTLENVYQNPTSTSNPEPNIKYLVVPPEVSGSQLVWFDGVIRFFNMTNSVALAAQTNVVLNNGTKVRLNVKTDSQPGMGSLSSSIRISRENYGSYIDVFKNLSASDVSTGYYEFYWPAGKSFQARFYGDDQRDISSNENYYNDVYKSFVVVGTAENQFTIEQFKQNKGVVNIVQPSNSTGRLEDLYNRNFLWYGTGNGSIFLPYGTYSFRFVPEAASGEEFAPAIIIAPYRTVSSSPINIEVNLTSGAATTVSVKLGAPGEEIGDTNVLPSNWSRCIIEKQVNNQWFEYSETDFVGDGTSRIANRLSAGNYRVSVYKPGASGYDYYGVVDRTDTTKFKCYGYVYNQPFTVSTETQVNPTVVLPQKPAFQAVLQDVNGGEIKHSRAIGLLNADGSSAGTANTGYWEYNNWYTSEHVIFYPFADPTQRLVIRAALPPVGEEPASIKLFAPISLNATGTTVLSQPLVIDQAEFVKVAGVVQRNGMPFVGNGRLVMNPIVPGTAGLSWSAWSNFDSDSEIKEFLTDPGFAFNAVKGQKVAIDVLESERPTVGGFPLNGFVPFKTVMAIGDQNILNHVINIQDGGKFAGRILNAGQPLPAGAVVGIKVVNSQNRSMVRTGVSSGNFMVSGLETGNYEIIFDIGGISSLPENARYASQTMPLISRKVFVDANAPLTQPVDFNLDPQQIGFLQAKITDDAGVGVGGLLVKIAVAADNNTGWVHYATEDNTVFYCRTLADGTVVSADSNQQGIPLESGEYGIFASFADSANQVWQTTGAPVRDYKLQLESYHSLGFISVQGGVATAFEKSLARLYKVVGTLSDGTNPLPFTSVELANQDANGSGGYFYGDSFYADSEGKFETWLKDGSYFAYLRKYDYAESSNRATLFLCPVSTGAAVGSVNVVFDPAKQKLHRFVLQGNESGNPRLANVSFNINFGETGDAISTDSGARIVPSYSAQSDENGVVEFSLTDLTSFPVGWQYSTAAFNKVYRRIPVLDANNLPVYDSSGNQVFETRIYTGPDSIILPAVPTTEPTAITFTAPSTVVVNFANIPARVNPANLIGFLRGSSEVTDPGYSDGPEYPDFPDHPNYPMPVKLYDAVASLVEGKFTFNNVRSGDKYTLTVYETFKGFDQGELREWYRDYFNDGDAIQQLGASGLFRHRSQPFEVNSPLVTLDETLNPLAELVINTSPAGLVQSPASYTIEFTDNPGSTSGLPGFPVIFSQQWYAEIPADLQFPILVPASYALRITVNPPAGSPYLKRTFENYFPVTGKPLNVVLAENPRIYGACLIGGQPLNGNIVLAPKGADFGSNALQRFPVSGGQYTGFLQPGFYMGYVVPAGGYAKYIEVEMGSVSQKLDFDLGENGHPITGYVGTKATDGSIVPLPGSAIRIMRKQTAASTLTDGQPMIPYPAFMGNFEIPCDPTGRFFFPAEVGVDYYIQAIVPMGFNPGIPVRVAGEGTQPQVEQKVNVFVGEGAKITGTLNVMGHVEAIPVGVNAAGDSFGLPTKFSAPAMTPVDVAGVTRYRFEIGGLEEGMLYDLVIWPSEGNYSYKKVVNVAVGGDPLKIDLSAGKKIVGQLVDAGGNPLKAANVPVSLAMTMPASNYQPAPAAAYYSVRQSVRASDLPLPSVDYSLGDAIMSGMPAVTDAFGRFTFNNVPDFLSAFIKTENGFSLEGVNYGRGRVPTFVPNFVDGQMSFNVVVPIGGKIVGKLLDDAGNPVPFAWIDAFMGQDWSNAQVGSDGTFVLEGLAPGANYNVQLMEMPGYVRVFRSGILVEPGKVTDLGTILVAKAVYAYGEASGSAAIMNRSFAYGIRDKEGIDILAIDGSRPVADVELLSGKFMQAVTGESNVYFDNFSEKVGFSMQVRPGKSHVGAFLYRESDYGFETLVSWGWMTGLSVPTQDQLASGAFDLSVKGTRAIEFPQEFGNIGGSLVHSVDTTFVFNPNDAVIALYPVVASGSTYLVVPTPFPAAMTRAINGKWFIRDVPKGKYRVKVITAKYGTVFFEKVIDIAADANVNEPISIGSSVKKIAGNVTLDGTTTPVSSAKVSLILKNISTSTDADGKFEFFLPVNELFIPQIEISKPGIKTTRFVDAGGLATAGVILSKDIALGELKVSGSVGSVEVDVKGSDGQAYMGAEVALVYQEGLVWTVGEVQITDENGAARFLSVPIGKEVKFRARAHFHKPTIGTLAAANNTGQGTLLVTMEALPPKVFYSGLLKPLAGGKLSLDANFDFNMVVDKGDLKLFIDAANAVSPVDRLGVCKFPDMIGTRLTTMKFSGEVPNVNNLVASVTHRNIEVGSFSLQAAAVFLKEFEVDPLSADGFTGRQVDASGTLLPTGITVPPGYLDPTIDSFKLEVATPTIRPNDGVYDSTGTKVGTPEFAGPTFKFTFGASDSNFGSGDHGGLFEITIAYNEGTKLEPRWYNPATGGWSKVGIIQESIKYDYPTKGYVTFKVDHLTEFAVLKNVADSVSGMSWDFDGDGAITSKDKAVASAWNSLRKVSDIPAVQSRARLLLNDASLVVKHLPIAVDDLNGDGAVNSVDLAICSAFLNLRRTTDLNAIGTRAQLLTGSASIAPNVTPGKLVNR